MSDLFHVKEFEAKLNACYPNYSFKLNEYNPIATTFNCPNHGDFLRVPLNLLNGHICDTCNIINCNIKKKDDFIKRANEKFNNLYDYSKFEFITSTTPGVIVCAKHGDFSQGPNNHIKGTGCPKCYHDQRYALTRDKSLGVKYPLLIPEWDVAGNAPVTVYDIFPNVATKYSWICIKPNSGHPPYMSLPGNKVKGNGCPKCDPSMKSTTMDQDDPWVLTQWSTKNDKPPSHYTSGSKVNAWWKCPTCNNEYQHQIYLRCKLANYKNHCPNCK